MNTDETALKKSSVHCSISGVCMCHWLAFSLWLSVLCLLR